jgi:transposase
VSGKLYQAVGSFDAVAIAAGQVAFAPLSELTAEKWQFSLGSKLMGQINLVQEAIPFIKEKGSFTAESAKKQDGSRRLLTIPGIGPLTATALTAAIGNATAFNKSRDLAAWLGLVPRQHSTGGKPRLLGISKRGDPYLRRLFIHGARSVLARVKRDEHSFGGWLNKLEARAPQNVAVVAMANKLARIAWAVLTSGKVYSAAACS